MSLGNSTKYLANLLTSAMLHLGGRAISRHTALPPTWTSERSAARYVALATRTRNLVNLTPASSSSHVRPAALSLQCPFLPTWWMSQHSAYPRLQCIGRAILSDSTCVLRERLVEPLGSRPHVADPPGVRLAHLIALPRELPVEKRDLGPVGFVAAQDAPYLGPHKPFRNLGSITGRRSGLALFIPERLQLGREVLLPSARRGPPPLEPTLELAIQALLAECLRQLLFKWALLMPRTSINRRRCHHPPLHRLVPNVAFLDNLFASKGGVTAKMLGLSFSPMGLETLAVYRQRMSGFSSLPSLAPAHLALVGKRPISLPHASAGSSSKSPTRRINSNSSTSRQNQPQIQKSARLTASSSQRVPGRPLFQVQASISPRHRPRRCVCWMDKHSTVLEPSSPSSGRSTILPRQPPWNSPAARRESNKKRLQVGGGTRVTTEVVRCLQRPHQANPVLQPGSHLRSALPAHPTRPDPPVPAGGRGW